MKDYPRYPLILSNEYHIIEFTSIGVKGEIAKVINFQPTENPLVYNLAFGDKINSSGSNDLEFDDSVNSDNGDRDIVLATIASAVFAFTQKNPDKWIYFAGVNDVRTRLYRMAITKNYSELCRDFHIFGVDFIDDTFVRVPFESSINFIGFIIKRKT